MNRAPKSLAELKEVVGIGEAFCRDYGTEVLGLVAGTETNEAGGRSEEIE